MLAVRGMTGNLDRDDVLGHIVPVVSAERHPGNPGAQESARALYSRQRGNSRSAIRRSYSAACSARMWMTMTSSSLMTLLPSSDRTFQSQVATRDGTQNTLVWIDARLSVPRPAGVRSYRFQSGSMVPTWQGSCPGSGGGVEKARPPKEGGASH